MNKHPRIQSSKELKLGEIVEIKDSTPRGTWRIGKIIEFVKSQDDQEQDATQQDDQERATKQQDDQERAAT